MHDLVTSSFMGSFMGSENGSPSLYSSIEGIASHGLPSVYSSVDGNENLYFPDRSMSEIEKLKGQPYGSTKDNITDHLLGLKSGSAAVGVKLSDTRMASRRAEEAGIVRGPATRRQQAALWLQDIVGNLGLSIEPTEEDLRLCLRNGLILCRVINKVQPGAVQKVVESPMISNQLDGAQSAYQYFENVRNFLVAVEDMGLPSFEASDLEQHSMSSNSSAKLVDCILALKSYHDWKQGGALGFWRLKSPNVPHQPTGYAVTSSKYLNRSKSMNMGSNNSRKKWALPDQESLDDTSLSSSPDQSAHSFSFEKDSRGSFEGISHSVQSGQNGNLDADIEELTSNANPSASTSTWLQDIGHKFREVLQVKARRMQDVPTATPVATESYGGGTTVSLDQNAPSQSLLSLISAILGDKPAAEVPMLVEFMLRKVMEEFERHLLTQRKQVTKMKSALKDIMIREEKLVSQNMVLEALAAGTQEEIKTRGLMTSCLKEEFSLTESKENHPPSYGLGSKSRTIHQEMEKKLIEEERRVKEEEVDRLLKESEEKQMAVQVLKHELDYIKHLDEEHLLHIEKQKKEIEAESKERIFTLEVQLQDTYKKMQEVENHSSKMMSSLREKDAKFQKFLSRQVHECEDLRWAQLHGKEEVLRMQMDWKEQLKSLEEQLQYMAKAASGYHKVLAENRMLYNEVQDLKGNIRVYCRVRPFLTEEIGRQTTIDYIGENGELMLINPSKPGGKDFRRSFTFNKCFGTNCSQEEVFLDTQPLIRSVLDGFNVCIFAYGQTGSGKTFTMSGPNNMTSIDWGVNYRALHDLFHMTQSRLHVFRYEIGVQMLEIYNEQVRDLLATDGVHKKLEIRNNSQLNGLNVPDASIMPVRSTDDVLELMKVGQKNRAVGATALNERSSRSHSVLTVHVQGTDLDSGAILRGSLHLVDLAGSERVDRSEATGDRLKEAQHINKSLSALGDVIAALAQKNGHVPYRNSKLTQLLQDSLGGQAKTLMFVHISPDVESFGETVSTLKFAERVSSVELGAARSNKESGEIQNLKEQVAQLKDAAAKKDAEIATLQLAKERLEKGDISMGVEKSKFKHSNSSGLTRRMSMDPTAAQKSRRATENGGGSLETRQSTRKLPGRKKPPSSLVLNTSNNSEDQAENFASSSACSPLSSPTEQKGQFEVTEDGTRDISDKLRHLKIRRNGTGNDNGSFRHQSSTENENSHSKVKHSSKQQEAVLAHHGEIIMHDSKYLPSILDTTPPSTSSTQDETVVKEPNGKSQQFGDDNISFFQEDQQQTKFGNGGLMLGVKGVEVEAGRSTASNQQAVQNTSRQRPNSNSVYFNLQTANGYFEPTVQEGVGGGIDGQENRGIVSKRSSFMLNDVVLDEHFENDEAFDLRDGYDSASLFSEGGLSAEADSSSLSQVDQNKKVKSSSARPYLERKGMLQTQVPRPPVKSTRKLSPVRGDRKSTGGLTQTRPRRPINVGIATSTEKPPKRNVSLTGISNVESESPGSRRLANGATSSASWR